MICRHVPCDKPLGVMRFEHEQLKEKRRFSELANPIFQIIFIDASTSCHLKEFLKNWTSSVFANFLYIFEKMSVFTTVILTFGWAKIQIINLTLTVLKWDFFDSLRISFSNSKSFLIVDLIYEPIFYQAKTRSQFMPMRKAMTLCHFWSPFFLLQQFPVNFGGSLWVIPRSDPSSPAKSSPQWTSEQYLKTFLHFYELFQLSLEF